MEPNEIPLGRRLFVFTIKERRKLRMYNGLYLGRSTYGNLTRAEDCFVLSFGKECRGNWKIGQHLLVSDGFELETISTEYWDKYKNHPALVKLERYAKDTEGKVICQVVHEDSVLAEVEGELFQEESMW